VLPWTGTSVLAFDAHHKFYAGPGESPGVFVFDDISRHQTQRPNGDGPNTDTLYDCVDAAEAQFSGVPCLQVGANEVFWLSAAPRSQHPGGVYVAYLDGHVARVSNEVDERVMAYAISIEDGQAEKSATE
jgi:prepilin-type processing-associated H-X9-DG protein